METKKHYVVTGGAGFIGSNLVRKLLEQNDVQLTCIDSFDPFYRRQLKLLNIDDFEKHHHFFLRDIDLDTVTIEELHQAIPQPVDVIVHLAARAGVRPSIADPLALPAYQHLWAHRRCWILPHRRKCAVCFCLIEQRVWRK
jgi:UDP-glucuronate 4-epimerase